ncbi:MAG: DNA helicase [Candidatus Sericytochromatia bacterium]|nr:MAG: DNA helicase [Candidatus Sericytochromatia bacterium]
MVVSEELNNQQLEAVNHINGPLLILAGAGSGKTRVLTYRTQKLIELGIKPYNILLLTFTNKAANEMKERINNQIGLDKSSGLWSGTFHSVCIRILRNIMGNNFVVYDTEDQLKLIKDIIKKRNIDNERFTPSKVLTAISKAKNNLIKAEEYNYYYNDYFHSKISDLYLEYQEELKKNNALDFDDILLKTIDFFNDNPDILNYYQNKFNYIMVDEYQDTNKAQYILIKQLSDLHKNICVVGDIDQSIYSFRNADFRIILNFQKDFENAKLIRLEKNYRSTKNIVEASNILIRNNTQRFEKVLYTDNPDGEKIFIYQAFSEQEEVRFITKQIHNLINTKGYKYKDFVILYRTNYQSRIFEEHFISNNIPHQIIGGFKFFERKEVKDIISYLKVIFNPNDSVSLERIINVPKRGIGNTTISKFLDLKEKYNLTLWQVFNLNEIVDIVGKSKEKIIKNFINFIKNLINESKDKPTSYLIKLIIEESGILEEIRNEDKKENKDTSREENIYQLINSAKEFELQSEDYSLGAYLSYISLITDLDSLNKNNESIKLMTIHNSKGLEFPVVFISGLAEGIFPHYLSETEEELEEERRLMYVAMTRAKEYLFITFSENVFRNYYQNEQEPSRFIYEIPLNFVNTNMKIKKTFYNEKLNSYKRNKDYYQGQKISTEKFGIGIIKRIIQDNNKKLLMINFESRNGLTIIDPSLTEVDIIE